MEGVGRLGGGGVEDLSCFFRTHTIQFWRQLFCLHPFCVSTGRCISLAGPIGRLLKSLEKFFQLFWNIGQSEFTSLSFLR